MSNILLLVVLALNIVFVNIRICELQKQVKELKFRVECMECCPHYPPCVYDEIDPGIVVTNFAEGAEKDVGIATNFPSIAEVFRNPSKGEWKAVGRLETEVEHGDKR